MALNVTQRATLAAHIRANTDPAVVAAVSIRDDQAVAAVYNQPSSFYVWRESVPAEDYREAIVWTEVDQLSAGAARIWEWITQNMTAPLNATSTNVRQGIADAFGPSTSSRGNLIAVGKEQATLAESLFATGTGSENSPGIRVFIGQVPVDDVSRALNENP